MRFPFPTTHLPAGSRRLALWIGVLTLLARAPVTAQETKEDGGGDGGGIVGILELGGGGDAKADEPAKEAEPSKDAAEGDAADDEAKRAAEARAAAEAEAKAAAEAAEAAEAKARAAAEAAEGADPADREMTLREKLEARRREKDLPPPPPAPPAGGEATAAETTTADGGADGAADTEASETTAEGESAPGDEDDSGDEDAAGAPPPPPARPKPPMFYMRDGTRLAGYPDVSELHVETAYGLLVVPVSEVQRLRFAQSEKQEFGEQLQPLIEQLGADEFDLREDAMERIRKLGSGVVPELRTYLEADDEEVRSRVEKLVEELEEEEEEPDEEEIHRTPLSGDEDEIVTLQFTAMGRIREEAFPVETRYGSLVFNRQDIIGVVFQEPLVIKQTFQLSGQNLAGKNQWLDTGISLAKGESYRVVASGSITIQNFGNTACGPEGTSNVPQRFEKFPAGAVVGRITEKGKPFLVGAELDGKAEAAGKLFLAIALRSSSIGGNFEIEVQRENKDAQAGEATASSAEGDVPPPTEAKIEAIAVPAGAAVLRARAAVRVAR